MHTGEGNNRDGSSVFAWCAWRECSFTMEEHATFVVAVLGKSCMCDVAKTVHDRNETYPVHKCSTTVITPQWTLIEMPFKFTSSTTSSNSWFHKVGQLPHFYLHSHWLASRINIHVRFWASSCCLSLLPVLPQGALELADDSGEVVGDWAYM